MNDEKIFIDKKRRIMVEQTIGFQKVLDAIKEKFNVKTLRGNGEEIVLVEKNEEDELSPKVEP